MNSDHDIHCYFELVAVSTHVPNLNTDLCCILGQTKVISTQDWIWFCWGRDSFDPELKKSIERKGRGCLIAQFSKMNEINSIEICRLASASLIILTNVAKNFLCGTLLWTNQLKPHEKLKAKQTFLAHVRQ